MATKDKDLIIDFANGFSMVTLKDNAVAAIINKPSSQEMFSKPDADPVKKKASDSKDYMVVPWGSDNDLPQQVIAKIGKSPDLSSNLFFNTQLGYGSGIMPVKIAAGTDNSGEIKMSYTPVLENKEINLFFENNDINGWLLEQLTDLNFFYHGFSSLLLNNEASASRKVVEIRHRDASFCRWEQMDEKGVIKNCLYSALWNDGDQKDKDITAIPALDFFNPTLDLKRKIGREVYPDAKIVDSGKSEFIISTNLPSPGRSYYRKPPWYALIESGWYDFAILIPEFKKAILNNQMLIKYMVYLDEKYFERIFQDEGLKTDKEKKTRVKKEYKDIQDYLSGAKNAGKAAFGRIRYMGQDGKERKDVIIEVIDHNLKGGEYIDDSEEVSNILAYGSGVHSSLIGSHGKGGTINGTESRELFIIKQAIMKPIRDRILKPLNVIKAINKWPDEVYFIIPNLVLTTLDSGTGSKKVIS